MTGIFAFPERSPLGMAGAGKDVFDFLEIGQFFKTAQVEELGRGRREEGRM
ncbi:hypothetical protein D3C81_1966530 [compost metagenome]